METLRLPEYKRLTEEALTPEPWPKAGSTLYYSLLHCDEAAIARARSALALVATLARVLDNVSEPAVAEQKVHWWHEELARLAGPAAGEGPRHPDGQRFLAMLDDGPHAFVLTRWWSTRLLAVLSENANERFAASIELEQFDTRIEDDYRARLDLLCAAIEGREPNNDSIELPAELVNGLGLSHRLRIFRQLYLANNPVWPDELYAQFGVPAESVFDDTNQEALSSLFSHLTKQARHSLEQGLKEAWQQPAAAMSANKLASQALLTGAELRLAQLKLWQRKPPDLLREYRGLTPFKKSLLLWRCQRRLARMQ